MAPRGGALCEGITTYIETAEDIKKTISTFADAGVDSVRIPVPFAYIFPSDYGGGLSDQTIHEW